MKAMFQSELIKTDVTSVKLLDNHILAGIGNHLNIFDINGHLIRRTKIFDCQKIHGILVDVENLLLYGGCDIHTLEWKCEFSAVKSLHNKQIDDWILTARWLKDDTLAVVVMKNRLAIYHRSLNKLREYNCQDSCILYSALIVRNEEDDGLVILSGTVFAEILVWKVSAFERTEIVPVSARLTGHNGVIFSVHYNRNNGYISSSSDDRSTILWSTKTNCIHKELEREIPEIKAIHKYYGHQSRIFRSFLTDHALLTAGEDSFVNVWNFHGELLNKIPTNQGGPVWALDCDGKNIISGGGGCEILMSSIESPKCVNCRLRMPESQLPKRIALLNDGNLIVCTESGEMYQYLDGKEKWVKMKQHDDLKNYCLLEVSDCRNLFALAGYRGEVYIYQSQRDGLKLIATSRTRRESRICSFHWLSCQTFLACEDGGVISLFYLSSDKKIVFITNFHLPNSSKLWSTAACQMESGLYVIGDKRGNIYVYELKTSTPIQVLRKVHNHLGITQLLNFGTKLRTLGRDGTIKTFHLDDRQIKLCSADKVPFVWLTDLLESHFLLAFSGKYFVIWDYQTRRVLLEHLCGGGHRSWDFLKRNGNATFSYVKERTINIVKWEEKNILPRNVCSAYHTNTINSTCIVGASDKKLFILASGGEDTTLRIIAARRDEFSPLKNFKSHLSSIKTLYLHRITHESCLLFSGGGRGQIICWRLFLNKDLECRQEYSHYEGKTEQLLESEFRIMDLKALQFQDDLLLFSACSDGSVNIFQVQEAQTRCRLYHLRNLLHKVKCISKITLIRLSSFYILITMSTDGTVAFWDVSRVKDKTVTLAPFEIVKSHQSGILSCGFRLLDDNLALLMTGGDDACIVLNLFKITFHKDRVDFALLSQIRDSTSHCAQVTGIWMSRDCLLTTSVDQKLLVFEWRIDERRRLYRKELGRYNTSVADIQGMECVQDEYFFHVLLYGKGVEYVKIRKNKIS